MKKFTLFAAIAVLFAACSSSEMDVEAPSIDSDSTTVTFSFNPYDITIEPMTRASSVADYITRLDIWLSDGTNTQAYNQVSSETGFATLELTLNKTKTYTLYVMGHRCSEPSTLSEGVISFPDDKVTQAFWYATTFTPATTTTLECTLNRIVAQFRLEITDVVPDDVTKFSYEIPQTYNRWSVTSGAVNKVDRTGTINLNSRNQDGSATINVYIIPQTLTNEEQIDITFSALTANDAVKKSWSFGDVPVRANYRTTYRGAFFTDQPVSITLEAMDWSTFDTITF